MTKTALLDIRRLIRSTKGRFFSLLSIVALGVAFFVGISATAPIMAYSVGTYNNELNLKDVTIYSSFGFDDEDIEAIRSMEDVKAAEGAMFVDVYGISGMDSQITRVHSYDMNGTINRVRLKSGRMPENKYEALAENGTDLIQGFALGSKVKLERPDGDLEDYLSVDEVEIVGTIDTPVYLNETKENSTLSNQYIHTYLYVLPEAFEPEFFLEVNVVLKDSAEYAHFSDAYFEYEKTITEKIKTLAETQADHRREEVVTDAWAQYNDGLKEYEDGKKEYDEKIADAEAEIADGEKELEDGRKELADGIRELQDAQATLDRETADGRKKIQDARDQIQGGFNEVYSGTQAVYEAESHLPEINEGIAQCDEGLAQIDAAITALEAAQEGLAAIDTALADTEAAEERLKQALEILEALPYPDETPLEDIIADAKEISDALEDLGIEAGNIGEMREEIRNRIESMTAEELAEYLKNLRDGNYSETIRRIIEENEESGAYGEALLDLIDSLPYADDTQIESIAGSAEQLMKMAEELGGEINTLGDLKNAVQAAIDNLPEVRETLVKQRDDILKQLKENGMDPEQIPQEIENLKNQRTEAENTKASLLDMIAQIDSGKSTLSVTFAELQRAYDETVNALNELEEKAAEAQKQINDGWAETEDARKKIADGEKELEDAKQELADAKTDGEQELSDAWADLEKAKQDIEELEEGSWTVLDRSKHYASETYRETVNQMKAIAAIFPVFFLLVAALVCLTTMTRLVDEHRGEIGVYRALGFSRLQCAMKYLLYAGAATALGEAIGAVLGILIFPPVIYHTWRMMYVLPEYRMTIPWGTIILTDTAFLGVMLAATWSSCKEDMREVPAQLMRPKPPKLGRSTILEKISFVWDMLPFGWKVTVRNLVRYKKRFFMTVCGVAGCCALLVTGFGIRDSINGMVDIQFDQILQYDGMVRLEDSLSRSAKMKFAQKIDSREDVSSASLICAYSAIAVTDGELEETVQTEVYLNAEDVTQFYDLRVRETGEKLHLDDEGVIINERLSENLDLAVGDTFTLESDNGLKRSVRVAGITEMYIQHYAFMTQAYYQKVFGYTPAENTLFITVNGDSQVNRALQEELVDMPETEGIEFYDARLDNFNTMVKGLDMIVWVIIVSSMALAIVVLTNLINVNISERQREIATLKVLGFRRREVQSYIYKENNIMTLIGSFAGIPIGQLLHHYIMGLVEMDYVIFGRTVFFRSIVMAVILTNLFGLLVNMLMRRKLTDIKMVESLKSVE